MRLAVRHGADFEMVLCWIARVRLVGILLLVYARDELHSYIATGEIYSQSCPTGLLNRMGNKGGVGISLRVHDTTFCFINSHLAAGNDELQRRNQDFREIIKIVFADGKRISDHDAIVWLGDLNYRLQTLNGNNLNNFNVREACTKNQYLTLLQYDQLVQMQRSKMAFHDFTEGAINFPPTYKYDPGTDQFDSSEKARVPAWCDRILWMAENTKITQLHYSHVGDIRVSDHKPVHALFDIKVKRIDREKFRKVQAEAIKEGDRRANEALPQVILDKYDFNFGPVRFLEPTVLVLSIRNVGKYPVKFKFRERDDGGGSNGGNRNTTGKRAISPDWLTVTTYNNKIDVGQEGTVEFQVLVDKFTAWKMNEKHWAGDENAYRLSDCLILQLRHGRDYFLTMDAQYAPSCFAQSLDRLMELQHTPVQKQEQLIDLSDGASCSTLPADLPVPKELFRLVEHIRKNGLDTQNIFGSVGSEADFIQLRDALDTGTAGELPECESGVHSVVSTMSRFLDSLSEPVVPYAFHDRCFRVVHSPVACWQTVEQMPNPHKQTFTYLIEFLRQVLQHSQTNGTDMETMCQFFADITFRVVTPFSVTDLSKKPASRERQAKAAQFIRSCVSVESDAVAQHHSLFDNQTDVFG